MKIEITFKNGNKETKVFEGTAGQALMAAHKIAIKNTKIATAFVVNENGYLVNGFTRSIGNLRMLFG